MEPKSLRAKMHLVPRHTMSLEVPSREPIWMSIICSPRLVDQEAWTFLELDTEVLEGWFGDFRFASLSCGELAAVVSVR